MKLCYQVATPDVAIADSVTAYQGPLEKSFSDLAKLGYQGVELMTLNPSELDWDFVKKEAEKNGLKVVLVCTGEIFGQLGLSYITRIRKTETRRSAEVRKSSTLRHIWGQTSTSAVSAGSTVRN